jgi:hypothetical protein
MSDNRRECAEEIATVLHPNARPLDHNFVARQLEAIIAKHFPPAVPVDTLLFCPKCKAQHVDAPEPENGWTNPPHRKHLCHNCGNIWLAARVQTNGVALIAEQEQI